MVSTVEAKAEVDRLLAQKFPKSGAARVDVKEAFDSDGQPSLGIRIVFRGNPAKEEMRYQRDGMIDQLRTWLARRDDERFPYFSFTTEQDEKEKELSQ